MQSSRARFGMSHCDKAVSSIDLVCQTRLHLCWPKHNPSYWETSFNKTFVCADFFAGPVILVLYLHGQSLFESHLLTICTVGWMGGNLLWLCQCNYGRLGDGSKNHHHRHRQCHKLQTAIARVLDELGRNPPKKENHLNTISKMMGTLVQVQLYTFSSAPVARTLKNNLSQNFGG